MLKHVQQACELYDSGVAVPRRPARSTFLLMNNKSYPAKFIRGLAYRLATGVELDPSRDYSGGLETVRFFHALGLPTQHDQSPGPAEPTVEPAPSLSAPNGEPLGLRREHREPQKRALAELLRCRYGTIEIEAQFPWLTVPRPDQMDETMGTIFHALQAMRNFSGFITPSQRLKCDFFLPRERLIVEYDERQHFTLQRAKALELYPPDLPLSFDREEWLNACRTIQATDRTPPYRDEQRAFYDSLRDIFAARNGVRLVRLRYGKQDWTVPSATEAMNMLVWDTNAPPDSPLGLPAIQAAASASENRGLVQRPAFSGNKGWVASASAVFGACRWFCLSAIGKACAKPPASPLPPAQTMPGSDASENRIKKIALVTHNYNVADSDGRYDYSEHFSRINQRCDQQSCDTILYALYTWDKDSPVSRNHEMTFKGLKNVQRIIIEVGHPHPPYPCSYDHVEVWQRGSKVPLVAKQRFAKSSASPSDKAAFLNDLPQRQVRDALLVLCGESNIASLVRGSDEVNDPYRFSHIVGKMKIRLLLNPIHDYMRRPEMREKRRYYSLDGRTVISVWNQGKARETALPWTVFHDGQERTNHVRELAKPFSDRPDIRIGILDLSLIS